MIVTQTGAVTLIGGGENRAQDLAAALAHAPYLVAADGGADRALFHGHVPHATIGDLDSLSSLARTQLPEGSVYHVPEQDSTDFEKCLSRIDAPLVLAVGFTGARMDHMLAVCSVLARAVGPPCLVIGEHDVIFALRKPTRLTLWPGARVSLMPMGRVRGRSEGLAWPIDGLDLAPMGQIGTSNRAVTEAVWIAPDGPGLLCMLPRPALAAAIAALGPAS